MYLIAAMLLVSGAQAGTAEAPKPREAVPEKKICRREVSTASRLDVRRTCRTRAEWDELDRASGRTLQRGMDAGRAGG